MHTRNEVCRINSLLSAHRISFSRLHWVRRKCFSVRQFMQYASFTTVKPSSAAATTKSTSTEISSVQCIHSHYALTNFEYTTTQQQKNISILIKRSINLYALFRCTVSRLSHARISHLTIFFCIQYNNKKQHRRTSWKKSTWKKSIDYAAWWPHMQYFPHSPRNQLQMHGVYWHRMNSQLCSFLVISRQITRRTLFSAHTSHHVTESAVHFFVYLLFVHQSPKLKRVWAVEHGAEQ